ncbi:hypothetical protein, partial [Candidatus Symbiothrix dinenymphae]|uniref:hypothetical protein n=1 Tax=Candidatus Symbiothrix dinenymphae TaxID=467085 RepID=UPI000AAF291A
PLVYCPDEHSFYRDSFIAKVDIELIVNKISFIVSDGIIVDVGGFCGIDKSMEANLQIPEFAKGVLRVEHDLKYGFAYSIHDDFDYEYPVYIDIQTGWVCVGNHEKKGSAVEFINNCVAMIDNNNKFVSLWLKPQLLPR